MPEKIYEDKKPRVIDLKNPPKDNNQENIDAKTAHTPVDLREHGKRGARGAGSFTNSSPDEISEELLKPYLGEDIFEPDKTEELINETIEDYNSGRLKFKKKFHLTSALRIKMAKKGYSSEQRDVAVGQLLEKFDAKKMSIETADVQSDRIKAELEELLSDKEEILGDEGKGKGVKIRECRRVDKKIDELEGKLKYFEVKKDDDGIIELTDEIVEPQEEDIIELTDEVKNIETADVQNNRIKAKLEELQSKKKEILNDNEKSKGAKIRGSRKIDNEIEELKEKLKYFEVEKENIKETEGKKPQETKKIEQEVLNYFKNLSINEKELKNIKGFSDLSEGQQLLVLENLNQIKLGRIQEEAAVKYRKNTTEAKFLGRIWQGISKKYQIAKLKKTTANEIEKGGIRAHQETLQQLVNGMREFGTEVKIQNGKLEIQYASDFKNLTPEQQKQVDKFNQIATEYSKTPYEWSLETANKKDRKIYKEVKEKYDKVKMDILKLKENEISEKDACLYINDVEMKVKLNQFLNSNPDVEKHLQNIKDKKVWLRALANVVTERGIYVGAGFLTRTATMSLIGLAGAPLVAAGMGGFMARRRAKGTLKERDILARKGMEDKSKEAKDFVDAEYIHESIDFLINELNKEPENEEKREEMIRSLKFHIEDAKNKIEDGTVNYGGKENRLFNQYELIKKISEGSVQVEYNGINNEKYQKDIESIGEFLKKQDKAISTAQKKYLRNQMMRGATISAGFATAGYAIRHFAGELFGWDKESGVVKKEIPEKEVKPIRGEALKQQSVETVRVKLPPKNTAKYDPFNTEFKKSVEAEVASKEVKPKKIPSLTGDFAEESYAKLRQHDYLKDNAAIESLKKAAEEFAPEHGIKTRFDLRLGEKGVPAHLERVMHAIAMNAMDDKEMYTTLEDGTKLFDEDPAARSLNVAANLTKMAQGELNNIKGVEISDEMRKSFSFNKETGQLEIKNYTEFNKLVENLHAHAEDLWTDEILQKGAVGYLDRIKGETWQDIIEANGLEENVDGHDDLDVEIKDFENSDMVQKAEKIIKAREAKILADSEIKTTGISETKFNIEWVGKDNKIGYFESDNQKLNSFLEERRLTIIAYDTNGDKIPDSVLIKDAHGNEFAGFTNSQENSQEFLSRVENEALKLAENQENINKFINLRIEKEYGVEETLKGYKKIDKGGHIKFLEKYSGLYKADYIKGIYEQMPDSIRNDGEQALNYLKISAGNDDEVSSGFKNMFNLKENPVSGSPYGFSKDLKTGILTIHNIDGKDGTNVLVDLENNKIGVQVEGPQKNWGIKSAFAGLGKRYPTEDLSVENLESVKEFFGGKNGVTQGFQSVDKERQGFIGQ